VALSVVLKWHWPCPPHEPTHLAAHNPPIHDLLSQEPGKQQIIGVQSWPH
jgi:hypothetical protein